MAKAALEVPRQDLGRVREIISRFRDRPAPLLPILQGIQGEMGWISEEAMVEVAEALGIHPSKVYGVATFYTLFATQPKGEHVIRVCASAPCHVPGAGAVLEALKRALGVNVGQTTPDGKFTLELTSCIGVCGVAPAIMIDDQVYGNLKPADIGAILARY
ncbi:MAG TPA: NADH-quinone oxidoreductase subunit NuoE [Firmicutes bacterium]|nr:NADH-quinone oxidoreductase subunit NuoE [Bacillota bacterium]